MPNITALDTAQLVALAAALGWASGIRLYAVLFITGLAGTLGWFALPEGLKLLSHPAMLGASGFMLAVEFFADKIPLVDSLWDTVQTVVRIPAGAALAAGAIGSVTGANFGADNNVMTLVAALLGGTLAATSHATKMTTRAAINTSPEPFSNIAMSLVEDGLVVGALWLATNHPLLFAAVLAVVLVLSVVLIVLLVKFLKAVLGKVREFFSGSVTESKVV